MLTMFIKILYFIEDRFGIVSLGFLWAAAMMGLVYWEYLHRV